MTRSALVDLSPDVYNQGCHYYPYMVSLNRSNGVYNGGCNRSIMCVRNKAESVKINAFNMATRRNELKTLTKHRSSKCKCKFDGTKCNSNQKRGNCKCRCEFKNPIKNHVWKRHYF